MPIWLDALLVLWLTGGLAAWATYMYCEKTNAL